jgi:hypothetical protein
MISELMSTQIQDWKRLLKGRIDFLGPLGIDGFSGGHHGSTSWVTLRLGMYIYDPHYLYTPSDYLRHFPFATSIYACFTMF